MKIHEGFKLRRMAGTSVVVATGEAGKTFSGVIDLNDSAALLFERLQTGAKKDDLTQALLDEYEVSPEKARSSVERFLFELDKARLLS